MQKVFSQKFSQNIWRILPNPDPQSDLWIIELRDSESKQVSFAMMDTAQMKQLWHYSPPEADWWSSLTAFSHNNIFLHNYRYPEVPEPTDLLAFSAINGQFLWALPGHLMVKSLDNKYIEVAGKSGEQFIYKACDAETGALSPLKESYADEFEKVILQEPVRYRKDSVYFEKLATFIQNITNGHTAVSIDYLEKRPYIMFSYYIYEQDKSVQYLLIVTDQKQLVLHEQLSEEREGMGRATMMLKASTLVYLKNNNEFSSLTLS
ncbi:DUF4905 domain-containing protein [Dyadobacter fanqingshengii]|uniref:DUF4905 domain-containing protein n=1 Tax=Dyadobacter fanqingshengii TaxID=2906443 RepID=A0A9X1P9E4_9BACT|nr:DUF4905 domain-containing protein [Dyadobacter fanqingshengii]MCF0039533.1 DUF4905 domain-containing protein [Dyadobacter fanqingshengii]USJ33658.1 DUF4905 domain-containing protein [Dyadobacter fanqingshengii]